MVTSSIRDEQESPIHDPKRSKGPKAIDEMKLLDELSEGIKKLLRENRESRMKWFNTKKSHSRCQSMPF